LSTTEKEAKEAPEKKSGGQGEIIRNASWVGLGTLLSRLAGLARDQVTAFYFGAGPAADAFFVAFRIPNLLRRLLAEGALTPAFVPAFTGILEKEGLSGASRLYRGVFTMMAIILAGVTVLGIILAPYLVRLIAPGFARESGQFHLTVLLTRILFPYILLISLTALAMGALNSLGRFKVPAVGPVLLNVFMILGAVLMSPRLERPIVGLALGALLGGLAQLSIQLPFLRRAGIGLWFSRGFRDPKVFRILKLMGPTALGAAAYQISVFINTQLASLLPEGSLSFLYYADRLMQFPLGVFSLALATAILPAMSRERALGREEEFRRLFRRTLALQFFITLPAAAGLLAMAEPLVGLLFQRGRFGPENTVQTALALWGYALGLPFLSGSSLAARAYYSLSDTGTPAKVAAFSLGLGLALAALLMVPLGHMGLALASSAASAINFFWLMKKLSGQGNYRMSELTREILAYLGLALAMGLLIRLLMGYGQKLEIANPALVAGGLVLGPVIYFGLAFLVGSPCLGPLKEMAGRLLGRLKGRS
jgi:putative peptidoglycan lipid II flippase